SSVSLSIFFSLLRRPPRSPLFPYTTLFRSRAEPGAGDGRCPRVDVRQGDGANAGRVKAAARADRIDIAVESRARGFVERLHIGRDRKSTRLNSSHLVISYAVFCLKKKKVTEDRDRLISLCEELALLQQVGIRVCVVHGGGKQLSELAKKLGIEQTIIEGRRVTDDDTLEMAKIIFAGKITTDILAALRHRGVHAVGLSGIDGNIVHALLMPPTEATDIYTLSLHDALPI